ncbi:hypothetical protein [Microlunatus parietis]|uniref:Uncharacterized protein n=1 Tax=Microlunatus parietis TaxID=682979 RepID=A0A7Y9I8N5_9ACTN|nr:hypothetical protein [Microlunatus parietis]NYE72386.1 hypothetical protein [Microlunatus parietis]
MDVIKKLHWPLILGLATLALVQPLVGMITAAGGVPAAPPVRVGLAIMISIVWIAVVGLTRVRHPVLTLVVAGISYGVFETVLSGVMSPVLTGDLRGPLAMPWTIIAVLITNAIWGAIAGLLALAVQRLRGFRPQQ